MTKVKIEIEGGEFDFEEFDRKIDAAMIKMKEFSAALDKLADFLKKNSISAADDGT